MLMLYQLESGRTPAEIRPGSPISDPEALLHNIRYDPANPSRSRYGVKLENCGGHADKTNCNREPGNADSRKRKKNVHKLAYTV